MIERPELPGRSIYIVELAAAVAQLTQKRDSLQLAVISTKGKQEAELAALETQLQSRKAEAAKLDTEIPQLESKLAELTAQAKHLKDTQARLTESEASLKALDAQKTELSGSVAELKLQQEELTKQAKLTAADGAAGDEFGTSVALDGDVALVGAYLDDIAANSDQGSTYVYIRNGTTWTQQAKLTSDDGASGDRFGASIALNGDAVLVGAHRDDIGTNSDQGSAYFFTRNGTIWT